MAIRFGSMQLVWVYVLHAFQKKAKSGLSTPRRELELIQQRLKWLAKLKRHGSNSMVAKKDPRMSSGNVFADLRLPRSEEALAKEELAVSILQVLRSRRLTQARAAQILGVDQPKISALSRGKLAGFSIERLIRFLVLLGYDVEIRVKLAAKPKTDARLLVA